MWLEKADNTEEETNRKVKDRSEETQIGKQIDDRKTCEQMKREKGRGKIDN